MELIDELGLTDQFQKIPQGRFQSLRLREDLQIGSFAELRIKYPYVAIAPQWDFLTMLADTARRFPRAKTRVFAPGSNAPRPLASRKARPCSVARVKWFGRLAVEPSQRR